MGLFGKKDKADDDSNRHALFGGSRSKSKSPAPAANPYARPDPYLEAKKHAYRAPEAAVDTNGGGDHRDEKQGGGNPYAGQDHGRAGYAANAPAGQSGYGADRYGADGQNGGSRYGAAGYGGLGGKDPYAPDDENRSALFGGAQSRVQQQQQQKQGGGAQGNDEPPPPPYDPAMQGGGGGGYGRPTYDDRRLTAEEEEEQEVAAARQQMRFMKQEDVSSTRNALRVAQRAEEIGRDTLARLGVQGEHIHNTEKNLDLANNQNRLAEERARELKTLNRSMFAVHVSNPFTSRSRANARDQAVIDRHLEERDEREATRLAAYHSDQRMQKNFQGLAAPAPTPAQRQKNLAERARFQFEADSEDEDMENEIDANLDALSGAAARLNALARATGSEVDEQNKHLDRIAKKGDEVDIGITKNHAKINRIK